MSISDSNERLTVIISKDLKAKIRNLAVANNRSISNYVVTVLENHVEKKRVMEDLTPQKHPNLKVADNNEPYRIDINLPDDK
ncbi:hypothetical protein [Robertmurraya siralis]|uniref:hypothetical protein n=1 Tax=Robertmurraya siralis TaxID=77777 RepID=UPI001B85F028|nr:hypothetical protein [Robertmurraya siralis]